MKCEHFLCAMLRFLGLPKKFLFYSYHPPLTCQSRLQDGGVVLVDLCNAAVGQDHGVLQDMVGTKSVSLTRSHRVDPQALQVPGYPNGQGLAVDHGVLVLADELEDPAESVSGSEFQRIRRELDDVVKFPNVDVECALLDALEDNWQVGFRRP